MTIKYKNSTTITIELNLIICSRFIHNTMITIIQPIEDIKDMIEKCERLSSINDSLFSTFSRIQKEALSVSS